MQGTISVGDLIFAPLTRTRPHDLALARVTGFQQSLGTVSFEFLRPSIGDSSDLPSRVFLAPGVVDDNSASSQPTERTFAALDKMRALLAREFGVAKGATANNSNSSNNNDADQQELAVFLQQLQLVFPITQVCDAWNTVLKQLLNNHNHTATAARSSNNSHDTVNLFLMDNWSSAFLLHAPCVLQMLGKATQTAGNTQTNIQEARKLSPMHEALLSGVPGTRVFDAITKLVTSSAAATTTTSNNVVYSFVILFAEQKSAALWTELIESAFESQLLAAGITRIVSLADVEEVEALFEQQQHDEEHEENEYSSTSSLLVPTLFIGSAEDFSALCIHSVTNAAAREAAEDAASSRGGDDQRHGPSCENSTNRNVVVLLGDDSADLVSVLAEMEDVIQEQQRQQRRQSNTNNNTSGETGAKNIFNIEHIDAGSHLSSLRGHGAAASNNSNHGNHQISQVLSRSQQAKKQQQQQQQQQLQQEQAASATATAEDDSGDVAVSTTNNNNNFVFDGATAGASTRKTWSRTQCRWGCCAPSCCRFVPCFPISLQPDNALFAPSVVSDLFALSRGSNSKLRLVLVALSNDAAPIVNDRSVWDAQVESSAVSSLRIEWCRVTVDTSVDLCHSVCQQLLEHWLNGPIDGVVVATAKTDRSALDSAATAGGAGDDNSPTVPLRNIAAFVHSYLLALNASVVCSRSRPRRSVTQQQLQDEQHQQQQVLCVASPLSYASPSSSRTQRRRENPGGVDGDKPRQQQQQQPRMVRKLQPVVFVRIVTNQQPMIPVASITAVERLLQHPNSVATLAPLSRKTVPAPFAASNEGGSATRWLSSLWL